MKTFSKVLHSQQGSALLLVTVGLAALAAAYALLGDQFGAAEKQVNQFQFRVFLEQYRRQMSDTVLPKTNVCKCFTNGMTFPATPSAPIAVGGVSTQSKLGIITSSCADPVSPLLTTVYNSDGLKLNSIKLGNVRYSNNTYRGDLRFHVETRKKVSGSPERFFSIPLVLKTKPAATPGQVMVTQCSVERVDGSLSPQKFYNVENGSSKPPTSGVLDFDEIPPTASGYIISYIIGANSNGRDDRTCDIIGGGLSLKLGMNSKGDGGQRMVGGTAYIPLDGCNSDLTYSCDNDNGRGRLKLLAYIDTGVKPDCSIPAPACVLDEFGNCMTDVPDTYDCPYGSVYNPSVDGCVPL